MYVLIPSMIGERLSHQPKYDTSESRSFPEVGQENFQPGEEEERQNWILARPSRVQHNCRWACQESFVGWGSGLSCDFDQSIEHVKDKSTEDVEEAWGWG